MRQKILYYITLFANAAMILIALYISMESYGHERFLVFLLAVPSILSIMTILRMPDFEEKKLIRRLRKANLRKELKALADFDS